MIFQRVLENTQKYWGILRIGNIYEYSRLRGRELKKPKNVTEIPNVHNLWATYKFLQLTESNFKRLLLNQLINESQINKPQQPLQLFEKILIIQSSIETLIRLNLVSSISTVVNGLLAQLEPFPFDSKLMCKDQNECSLSIKHIRNAIEMQYLSWKYKVQLQTMKEILCRYRLCLYEYRSMANLKRNIDMLDKLPKTSNLSVAEKVYLINQKPFNINFAQDFEETIAGLSWQLLLQYYPNILQNSHQYILFVISTLSNMNFTKTQIQYGLPFLQLSYPQFLQRLNNLMGNVELAKYRDEDKFLKLLSYPVNVLQDMINLQKADFTELTEIINASPRNNTRMRLNSMKSILYHINQFFEIGDSCIKTLKKHPKFKLVPESQIQGTLKFLKSKNFESNEVAESITIILYPSNVVEEMLAKIYSEEDTLLKYGFKNGCVPTKTFFFKNGTKEKQKVLQLCLYYLEKPHQFSGDGIWDCEVDSVTDAVCIKPLILNN